MTPRPPPKDLIVLAADGQIEFAIKGLLTRGLSLQFREVTCDIYTHPAKDPGCFLRGHDFLRLFHRQYAHALVVFDREGCGRQALPRPALEADLEQRLAASGWRDRAAAVAIDPELEVWVWSDSPEVDAALGWTGRSPALAAWLLSEGYCTAAGTKPLSPKKALEHALRLAQKRRSSAIYRQLAERVSAHRCIDPAFLKLKTLMRTWFAALEP
jgi:hypothetical protein